MKIRPIGLKIMLEPIDDEPVNIPGFVKPDGYGIRSCMGKVLAKGPECSRMTHEGDTVIFDPYQTTAKWIDGKEVFFIYEPEIIAVIVS